MSQSKIKKLSLGIYLALAALPMSVFAAGLGQLNVSSGIGEPLKANIELLSVSSAERASLKARIAPRSTYEAQGLARPASHSDIRMRVTKSGGKDILKLYSTEPMAEPFLDMLVELEWETGRILREYTVLLDPPGYEPNVSASQIQSPKIKTVDNTAAKPVAPIKKSTGAIKNTVKSNTAKPAATPLEADHLTKKGDTLSKIARQMQPAGVSLDQMLIGLYEANPEAFVGKNMNRLKVGKILQPPTEEALKAITRRDASKAVKVHTTNWKQYRNKLAGVVAQSAPEESEVDSQAASGKVTSAEDKSAPKSTGPKDVVKLSAGDAKAQADMEAKIIALQEEVSAREKGLQEAQERTAALEKQIEDMQKLLTLRSNALADAQAPTEGAMPEQTAANEAVANVAAEEPAKPTTAVVETAAEPAKPVAQPKPVQPKPAAPAPTEKPSFVASILDTLSGMFTGLNATILAAGGGLIALLLGGWLYLRNKRRKNLADFEQGIMTSGGLKANTVFGNTSGASVDTGDTSFLTDFSQSTSGGVIDTNDVDPIAEAEVYMAYGRDAQAEEILKDAISKEPKRYELHLKLLEMYAASKNISAFETVSGELYTTLGADDPTWAKVAEIGIKLEPNNPLYQAKAGVGTTEGASTTSEGAMAEVPQETTEVAAESVEGELDASDFSDSPLAAEADLDFSLNDDAASAESEVQADDAALEDIAEQMEGDAVDVGASALDLGDVSSKLDTEDTGLDFDLNVGEVESAAETVEEVADTITETPVEALQFENTMPNLDLPAVEEEVEAAGVDTLEADTIAQDDAEPATEAPVLEKPTEALGDLSLDLPQEEAAEADGEATSDEVSFDVSNLGDDTITFDVGETEDAQADAEQESGVLDMSDVSLDMNDEVNAAIDEAVTSAPEPEAEESESEEVETKLELVVAYIDMEDKEGAKELLDEVLKEGGANQRKRAEELLASIG